MNKKALTILIAAAAILIAGIAIAVVRLYHRPDDNHGELEESHFAERHRLIKAVPSDAAVVICVKNFGRACEIIGDSLTIFGELTSEKFDKIASGQFQSLRKAPAIMSVHCSKDMQPLLVIEAAKAIADTTADLKRLISAAGSSRLHAKIYGKLVLISSSETVINSSVRHLEEGHNIMEAQGFNEITSTMQQAGDDLLFFSNAYTDNVLGTLLAKKDRKSFRFIKELAEWTAFSIEDQSESGIMMHGGMLFDNDPSYYLNVLGHAGSSGVEITDAVPGNVALVLDISIGNITSYIKAYRNYLDTRNGLSKYESSLSGQKKETGINAEEWALNLNIREVAVASMRFGENFRSLILIRPADKHKAGQLKSMSCPEFAETLFGKAFKAEDESTCALVGGWIVIGARECVEKYSEKGFLEEPLTLRFKSEGLDRVPQKHCGAWAYHSLGEDPESLDTYFAPTLANRIRTILKGAAYVPVTLSISQDGGRLALDVAVDRIEVSKGTAVPASSRDTTVTVPQGPFNVRNCATGKTNTLYQNSHLSICLRDENGKDVWGVPFKSKICGYVQEIDYYNNGKIQFLFAAGSQMYLIDRLGRFVSGFPSETGKKIAAGPAVYDFTGAKGYTAMVLHTDNTVGYYNLHGKQVPSWKGITADETIKSLPELLEGNGKKYWVVRTSAQTMIFPFQGGEALVKGEGGRMIRPDSKIEITDKGFCGVCHDGRERTFKPGK